LDAQRKAKHKPPFRAPAEVIVYGVIFARGRIDDGFRGPRQNNIDRDKTGIDRVSIADLLAGGIWR